MQTVLSDEKLPQNLPDRRRHPRYRFSIPITIRSADGTTTPGITMEISESGLSAVTAEPLKINDTVELDPVCRGKMSALVRRRIGRVYGFEFLHPPAEDVQRIRESCKTLAQFRGDRLGI